MSFPITCPGCRARLKLPPGTAKKKARCPKCHARVNLAAALDATAYHQDSAASLSEFTTPDPPVPTGGGVKPHTPPKSPNPSRPVRSDEADTVVLPVPVPLISVPEREEDPLPYPAPAAVAPGTPTPPPGEPLLTLDDDPVPTCPATNSPPLVVPQPFRTPAEVTSDSAGLFTGACEAVLVPHGLFLESIPYRPFLYAPTRTPVSGAGRDLVLALPGPRSVTVRFAGPDAARIADDTAGFLAGERPAPALADYRRAPVWLLSLAVIFALGLAAGPLVAGETTDLGPRNGALVAVGFAVVGLLVNATVVLLLRATVPVKVAAMGAVAALGTGVFVAAISAYAAGRKHEAEQAREVEPAPLPTPPPKPAPPPEQPTPQPPVNRLLTAQDTAIRDGVYAFEEGPDEVTAVALTPDGKAMLVAHRTGALRMWRFEHLALVDTFAPRAKLDGPVSAIRFDSTGELVFLSTPSGTAAMAWDDPPAVPVKIAGEPFVAFPSPKGERFATARGNALTIRYLPTALVKKPDPGAKGFPLLQPRDEVIPADVKGQILLGGQKPTFLAWHPAGKLLGGHADGSIVSWGAFGPRFEVVTREHKAAVRVWAASPTGDFATGDAAGIVGLWANKSMTPQVFAATSSVAAGGEITHLAFSPSGALLAAADAANVVWVWNLATMKPVVQVTRPTPVRGLAFGPTDDLILLGTGRTVELWHRPALAKQP